MEKKHKQLIYSTPQSKTMKMYMDHKICQGSTDPFNPGGEADSMEGASILEQFLHL